MRSFVALLIVLCPAVADAQHLTFTEWSQKSMLDMRLAPRFGDREKNAEQKASDAEFVRLMLATDSVPRSASNNLVLHGFDRLRNGDMTAAMYRFNQAFLMDSTNSDIYWGYGSFFMELDRPAIAHTMYRAGLSMDSTNAHLHIGEATAYLAEAHTQSDSLQARDLVQKALAAAQSGAHHDPTNAEAWQRIVIAQLELGMCAEARASFVRYAQLARDEEVKRIRAMRERLCDT